jgi:hypothetical protein
VYGNVCLRHWLKVFERGKMGNATALCSGAARMVTKAPKKHKQLGPSKVTEKQR